MTNKLVGGWMRYFGHPDSMVIDAEGAFRGMAFETMTAQCGIHLRVVPPDAHYQLGKVERHGQTIKWMVRRLVNQFAALTQTEMDVVVGMSVFAKNTMVRRSGASPAQWGFRQTAKNSCSLAF